MNKQFIIAIGREFGSGGHEIAQKLAEHYQLPLYDQNILNEIANSRDLDHNDLIQYDETKRNKLLSRTVRGFNNSPAQNIALLQFDYLKKKAVSGESFVIVGRCAESVLKDFDGLISIFFLGDMDKKVERISAKYNLSKEKARKLISEKDHARREYHNSYCDGKWGDAGNYHITLNSSKLPMDEIMQLLIAYIDLRKA